MEIALAIICVLTGGGTVCFVNWCRYRTAVDTNEHVLAHRYRLERLAALERNSDSIEVVKLLGSGK